MIMDRSTTQPPPANLSQFHPNPPTPELRDLRDQIEVRVRPSQSSYFAGERFECQIDFSIQSTINKFTIPTPIPIPNSNANSPRPSPVSSPFPTPSPTPHPARIPFNHLDLLPHRLGRIADPIPPSEFIQIDSLLSPKSAHQLNSSSTPNPNPNSNPPPISDSLSPNRHHYLLLSRSVDHHPSLLSPTPPSRSIHRIPDPPTSPRPDPQRLSSRPTSDHLRSPQRKFSTPCASSHPWEPQPDQRRASLFGTGSSAPPHRLSFQRTDTAVLGWTYCQLEGFFEIDDHLVDPLPFAPLRTPRPRGGGQLVPDKPDQGWVGWLFGGSRPEPKSSPRRFPVFQNPISLLDVDIRLAPGETRTYSFAIDLPIGLPPSHRGKAIRFGYELVVGTNCLSRQPASAGPAGRFSPSFLRPQASQTGSPSQMLRLPVRIFNHIYVNRPPPSYDLLQPIIHDREIATTARVGGPERQRTAPGAAQVGLASLRAYAARLLGGVAEARQAERGGGEELEGGCKTAVEIVSRAARKVTFDINQDGRPVAQLALAKSVYRLGETVEGTVEMGGGRVRVLRLAISLETVERLASWAGPGGPHRRVHAEQEELVVDTARTRFALVIPSEAAPEFETTAISLHWVIRLRLQFAPPPPPPRPHLRTGSVAPAHVGGLAGLHARAHSVAVGYPSAPTAAPPPPPPPPFSHLMIHSATDGTFKAVPELGYVPVIYGTANQAHDWNKDKGRVVEQVEQVLVPVNIETVECEVPVRIIPGNTRFKPNVYRVYV